VGALTLSQLLVEVQAGLGNRVDLSLTQFRLINSLNIAQQRLGRFYDYQEMNKILATPTGITGDPAIDKYLPMPPGLKSIHSLILQDNANSQKLIEKPWRMYDKNVPLPEYIAPGWPAYYTRFGVSVVMLFPIPLNNFNYFMRATMLATPFTSANLNVVSDFVDKDDILIDWAIEYLLRLGARPDLADGYDKMALSRAGEAKATDEARPDMDASLSDMTGDAVTGAYWQNAFIKAAPG
jgi:hypothetical protein